MRMAARFSLVVPLVALAGCAPSPPDDGSDGVTSNPSNLSSDQRLQRETIVRDVAAANGLHNGLLLAGIAEAEVHLAHCWSEAQWACPGPASSDCAGGAVVAGSADGPCPDQAGGLGMFQFDSGNYTQTLAAHGDDILTVAGSTSDAVDFVVNMAIQSAYTPTNVVDRASALAWLDQVTIDGPTYDAWMKTVVRYYNGCNPDTCSVYTARRQQYDTAIRTVHDERGDAFWGSASPTPTESHAWQTPIASTYWKIDFDIVNPGVPGYSNCFQKPMNQIVHSGEDWANAAGTNVGAIGPGTVVYAAYANYPGWVVVIRHDLSEGERAALGVASPVIFSQYGHLTNVQVSVGQSVTTGQHLADILDQGSNSHVHWEVRTVETPDLCGHNDPGPGYTDSGTDARDWGYLDPADSVATLASAGGGNPGSGTCDNGVPLDGTACAHDGDGVEYVCKHPGLPSDQQWETQSCAPGAVCSGNACQGGGGNDCASRTTLPDCNASNGACAWYACVNGCFPFGSDIDQICGGGGGDTWSCADSAWGSGQVWTCGTDGNRHECASGTPAKDTCAHGCFARNPGQDDLCIKDDPGWSCASSAWGSGQLWTCNGGHIHECQGGTPVRVDCPSGCNVMAYGDNDTCQ